MILTPYNIKHLLTSTEVIRVSRVYGSNKVNTYRLLNDLEIHLSNGDTITIPRGYVWDLSSVPRFLWFAFAPDGDFQIAALIHDYLYEHKLYTRYFADREMFIWSIIVNGTRGVSFRNFDNLARFYAVRLFGWYVWNK
jgi:hypothetical protein